MLFFPDVKNENENHITGIIVLKGSDNEVVEYALSKVLLLLWWLNIKFIYQIKYATAKNP
ncbi:hypothetical protein AR687_18135 [Flavobacteriaceae bacterium CRH]|nr:hypothetical protein AR687_18135 [Flavobacteriaceae bacterium CRH]